MESPKDPEQPVQPQPQPQPKKKGKKPSRKELTGLGIRKEKGLFIISFL